MRLLGLLSSKINFLALLSSLPKNLFMFIKVWYGLWTSSFLANEHLETIILYYDELDLFKKLSSSIIVFDYLEVRNDLNFV